MKRHIMARVFALAALLVPPAAAGSMFKVRFDVETTVGAEKIDVVVHEDWAPIGAARFKELVESGFYDDTRFFRVIPSFMVQFGLSGDPEKSKQWRQKTIMDEPVKQTNKPGYLSFAKTGAPNSRTTQLFINYVDNARLDGMGFAPFAHLAGPEDMAVAKRIFNCGESPNQGHIQSKGNAYLDGSHPKLSKIVKATVVEPPKEEV